jgi:hypothetical protein|tara:strand:+ start:803 stop:1306 length:504 start_codon:yes stop_codon:yes gene_type:complete
MDNNKENPLENALNIEPTEVRKTTHNVKDPAKVGGELRKPVEIDLSKFPERKKIEQRKDFGEVRENIKEVIDYSKEAIDGILKVASESDSPRAYEVVSQLLKTATEANKDLLDIHKQMKTLEAEEGAKNVTNNAFFVGSTKELQELVRKQLPQTKKAKKVIDNDKET